ncbi:MAG: hypothetical protein AABZ44_07845 [Elusimicrobiota bacterium]
MANFFRKRRIKPKSNKNEQKVMRGIDSDRSGRSQGTLASLYPTVRRLTIAVKYLSVQSQVLDESTQELSVESPSSLSFPCPGRCGLGSFDLVSVIGEAVDSRKESVQDSQKCQEAVYSDSHNACGCELKYKIDIVYFPASRPNPAVAGS